MILTCGNCGGSLEWSLDRVGHQPMMMSNCRHCNPGGAWFHEPVEIIRKPRGKASLWPAPTDAPKSAASSSEFPESTQPDTV